MIKYYRLNKSHLNKDDILEAINYKNKVNRELKRIEDYYIGINGQKKRDLVPIPIGRKLIKSVVGFMFKENAITYAFTDKIDDRFKETIQDIYDYNDEENENVELGSEQAKFGVAYEIVYIDEKGNVSFNCVPVSQILPIYSYGIKPTLIAAINHYCINKVDYVEVYYKNHIEYFMIDKDTFKNIKEDKLHFFGEVPLLEFRNNKEGMGDIEAITGLIDAHDKILANGVEEDGIYADALLLLKGATIDGAALTKIRELRILELEEDQNAEYLTKQGAYDGRETLRKVIENLIYTMSGIPNLDDKEALSQKSGEALKYLYATFEVMVAGDKQSGFNAGLYKRLRLICNYLNWARNPKEKYKADSIKINWKRNLPSESTVIIDNAVKLNGVLSKETLLEQLEKADVITSVEQELNRIEKEKPTLETQSYES